MLGFGLLLVMAMERVKEWMEPTGDTHGSKEGGGEVLTRDQQQRRQRILGTNTGAFNA